MAVLLKGTTFSSGQSVDHTDMNNIIDTATLNPSESTGIIGSQTAEAAIDGGDFVLVQDVSGTDILRKATVANIVGASGQVTATSLDSSEGTGGVIGGQTEEAAVASDDFVLIQDMSGTDILRKATVANLIGSMGIIQTSDNTAVGSDALDGLTSGVNNVAVGRQALTAATDGNNNVAVGHQAGFKTGSSSNDNVVVGYHSGYWNVNGDDSVVIGSVAGKNCVQTDKCVIIGKGAMELSGSLMTQNVAVGYEALKNSEYTTGIEGNYNVALGALALATNTTGAQSTAVGYAALKDQTTPGINTGLGYSAGSNITTATDCTLVGFAAGETNITGDDNTFVGDYAGYYVTAGQNTALGSGANTVSGAPAAYTNTTCLGYEVNPTAANQVRLGNASITSLECQVALVSPSDERVKKNVKASSLGLSFLNALRAVSFKKLNPFEWPEKLKEARFLRNGSDKPSDPKPKDDPNVYTGFIAQEVKNVLDDQKITEWDGWSEGDDGMQKLTMTAFIPALIKGVQELSAKVEKLEAK